MIDVDLSVGPLEAMSDEWLLWHLDGHARMLERFRQVWPDAVETEAQILDRLMAERACRQHSGLFELEGCKVA